MKSQVVQLSPQGNRFEGMDFSKLNPVELDCLVNRALNALSESIHRGDTATNPDEVRQYWMLRMGRYEHEVFAVMLLDTRHRIIHIEELFRGTIDGTAVYAREVVKLALQYNAGAVIFAHNHPSGVADPSVSDIRITEKLKAALGTIDVRVLDHVVVSATDSVSLAGQGKL